MGLIRLLSGLEVGAWSCWARSFCSRWLLIVLCGCRCRCLLASHPGAAGSRASVPPAGHHSPEQVMGRRSCSAYWRTRRSAGGGVRFPCCSRRLRPGRLPPASRRLGPRTRGGGGTLQRGGGGAGRGAAAGGTPWGSCRTPGEAAGPYGGHGDVQVEGKPQS